MTRSIAGLAIAGAAAVSLAATAAPAVAGARPAGTHPSQHNHAVSTTLTIRATKNPVKGDHYKASVTGTLRARHKAVAGEPVELFERKGSGKTWTDAGSSQTTDANGHVVFSFTQSSTNEQYQLRFAGDTTATPPLKKSHSGTISVHRARSGGSGSGS